MAEGRNSPPGDAATPPPPPASSESTEWVHADVDYAALIAQIEAVDRVAAQVLNYDANFVGFIKRKLLMPSGLGTGKRIDFKDFFHCHILNDSI